MSSPRAKSVIDDPFGKVAIVGMAGRFPGADDVPAFWRNLRDGVESVAFFTPEELREAGVPDEVARDPAYVPAAARLESPELFDAAFFDVNPREAELTDPQQRILLEVAWSALEDAAVDVRRAPGSIGLFAGTGRNHYLKEYLATRPDLLASSGAVAETVGNEKDFVATRLAYKLGLRGPCVSVQTACSTSLVAVHLATQSLLNGECDVCLAGGASVTGLRKEGYLYVDGGIFSPDGHLRAFDERAAGQIGGNGAAMVVLKRLEDALDARDTIRAVILGSAVNNDGSQKVSFTAPGVEGQAQVVTEALALADADPESIAYIECHGTGTQLGDPIEVRALTQAFRSGEGATQAKGFCGIGSLKTNVGHLDAAAGVAGLIKASLALQHGELPASLHFERPNPELDLGESPFYVQKERAPLGGEGPWRAGVSSFGMGGTNAHAILQEPPPLSPTPTAHGPRLLCLSARTRSALETRASDLAQHLAAESAIELSDLSYTLAMGRTALEERRALVVGEGEQASACLGEARRGLDFTRRAAEGGASLAFLFPGQGAQYAGMARALYEHEATVRTWIDRGSSALTTELGLDLRELLFPAVGEEVRASEQLANTRYTQPALFVVEYALAQHLIELGLRPSAMIGHSIGEYVAAALAGVFRFEDALGLVALRGRRIGELPAGGCMLAVHAGEDEARARAGLGVDVAAVNAPGLTVLSGPEEAIEEAKKALRSERIATRRLETSHAFHSALMDPILADFEKDVAAVPRQSPELPIVSTRTGTWLSNDEAVDPAYWSGHVRDAVRFADGAALLLEKEDRVLIEVGPGTSLTTLAGAQPAAKGRTLVSTTAHPKADEDGRAIFLAAIGAAWTAGVDVPFEQLFEGEEPRRIPLPTYPFERRRFWIERGTGQAIVEAGDADEKRPDIGRWLYSPTWMRCTPTRTAAQAKRSWVVLTDGSTLGDRLAVLLRARGDEVELLGDVAAWSGEQTSSGAEVGWICLSSAASEPGPVLEDAFHRPVAAAQALLAKGIEGRMRFVVVTRSAQAVLGDDVRQPENAAAAGVIKALDAEAPGWGAAWVDLDQAPESDVSAEAEARALFDLLVAEELHGAYAVRGRHAWAPSFEEIPSAAPQGVEGLRSGDTVLVTGGLGGIGLVLAEELAEAGARLVLMGRSALPERSTWEALVADPASDESLVGKLSAVLAMEAKGAEVLCVDGDVGDAEALARGVSLGRERFGRIDGIVHSAGVPGGGLLSLKKRADAEAVLRSKVAGTRHLMDLFQGEPPRLFVLSSSLATVLPGVGQVDYFAANACLDAFAHAARARGFPAVAIDWDAWSEVGMAVETSDATSSSDALRRGREESLRLGIASIEGREVMRRALASGLAQVHVSTRDLHARLAAGVDVPDSEGAGPSVDEERHPRPALATPFAEPESATEERIAATWAELLGLAQVGRNDAFFDLGGNSLLLMQVSSRLREDFDINLSVRALFDTPDVASLAERVDGLVLVRRVGTSDAESEAQAEGETEEFRL